MPDTPTYAYVKTDDGAWLASQYWIIDTTYDHDWYVRMVGASLRVPRRTIDWRCWCGADIRGLGGSAPGTHSIAEAPQWISHHVLVDDGSWKGRIITLRPRSGLHLFVEAEVAAAGAGTNVDARSANDETNQNWIVLTSKQGRTALVPVSAGTGSVRMEVEGGVWDDGANIRLNTQSNGSEQSLYLHDRGDGYHMLVFECSGCALDHAAANQSEGANMDQWNPYGDWTRARQHFLLEEPLFRETETGSMTLEGNARVGEVLSASDPASRCLPCNCAGTEGMLYCTTWYRGSTPGSCNVLCQDKANRLDYLVGEGDEGNYLTCIVTARTRYGDIAYRGEVALKSGKVKPLQRIIRFFVDGASVACCEDECARGQAYSVPDKAFAAARKAACSQFDGWYLDAAYTKLFEPGSVIEEDLDLFARNGAVVRYGLSAVSCFENEDRQFYRDAALSELTDAESLLPPSRECWYGDRVAVQLAASVWFEDRGRAREAPCRGGYAAPDAKASPFSAFLVTGDTTIYLDWHPLAYDGVAIA